MKGKIKKFDKKLHNKYDIPAREVIKKCLGDFVFDNPNIYGVDLLIKDETCKYKYIELQVCSDWCNNIYPHKYPFVFARKSVYTNDTLFLTLDRNLTRCFLFDRESLNKTPIRYKKYSREYIYEIPWCRTLNIQIENLDVDMVKMY